MKKNTNEKDIYAIKKLSEMASILEREHTYFNASARHANALILSGTVDANLLSQALEFLYWNHPLLRSTIRFDKITKAYYLDFHSDFSKIPIKIFSQQKTNTWRTILSDKLSEQFPTDQFLWEATLIPEENNKMVILLHFHHSICDGASTAMLQHQLMIIYESLTQNKPIHLPNDFIIKTSSELFKNPKTRSQYIEDVKKFREKNPLPNGKIFDEWAEWDSRKTKNILFAFELTALKITIAKKNVELNRKYTVNDIVVSALLLAYKKIRSEYNEISLSTCVNLRKYFVMPLGNHILDCLFDIIFTPLTIDENISIWDVAYLYQTKRNETIETMLQTPIDFDCASLLSEKTIADIKNRKHFTHDICTSNIGLTDIQNAYADLTVEHFNFFTNQISGFCEIIMYLATVQQTVFGNFAYAAPLKQDKDAMNLGKHFLSILKSTIPNFKIIIEKTDHMLIAS